MITFPGLGIELNIDRVAFSVFEKDIYWYGIIIAFGIMAGLYLALSEAKRVGVNSEYIYDITLYGILFGIPGARLYFLLFNPGAMQNIWDFFAVWEGGIAIYGAVIASVISSVLYCRVKKISFLRIADICSFGLLMGQAIGRWGNFVNREAYGRITGVLWRMGIIDDIGRYIEVHPTFLYESLWNLLGLVFLTLYKKHKKFQGELFLLYIAWYGTGRAWIENLRVDSLPYDADFKISQILALLSAIIAIWTIIDMRKWKFIKKY